jgi:NitT/TauT family transport system permease protein
MTKNLFELRKQFTKQVNIVLSIIGLIIILAIWSLMSGTLISEALLPPPMTVLKSFKELHYSDYLIVNSIYSIKLNLLGYLLAIVVALPLGFVIGLFGVFRGIFRNYINAIRFIPLTATVGLFIAWFGIEDMMKVQFLAFGIFVYLLPVIIQRIDEVPKVYVDTVYTLGATKWQTIKSVFIPNVLSRVSDDIRVLVAISWTYIIVAELVNKQGGLGDLVYTSARQSRIDKVFAVLIVIVSIGLIQDRLFAGIDRLFFPYKYQKK